MDRYIKCDLCDRPAVIIDRNSNHYCLEHEYMSDDYIEFTEKEKKRLSDIPKDEFGITKM